jgi:hypothetical protein
VTQLTANGNTYSDAGEAAKDMQNGGHRTHLLPMLSDVLTDVADAATDAATASAAATSAQNYAAALNGTSTTSLTVGTGTKNITTQSGKNFVVGEWLLVARTAAPTNYMVGQVTSYSTTALVVEVTATGGSGTYTDWTISPSGSPGPTGLTGPGYVQARSTKTSGYTLVFGDLGNLIDCTSGTFTLAFTAAWPRSPELVVRDPQRATSRWTRTAPSRSTADHFVIPGEHRRCFAPHAPVTC